MDIPFDLIGVGGGANAILGRPIPTSVGNLANIDSIFILYDIITQCHDTLVDYLEKISDCSCLLPINNNNLIESTLMNIK